MAEVHLDQKIKHGLDMRISSADDILNKRSVPIFFVFDENNSIVFMCTQASVFIDSFFKENNLEKSKNERAKKILSLCEALSWNKHLSQNFVFSAVMFNKECPYLVRKILFSSLSNKNQFSHYMIMIEKFSFRRKIHCEHLIKKFNLTKSEYAVVTEVVTGASNRDVASSLCLSEYTVKDHLKKIMFKMDIKSRTGILCRALE